jgi:hypothetical protein
MKTRIIAALGALAIVTAILFVGSPAQAAPVQAAPVVAVQAQSSARVADCTTYATKACAWDGRDYTGKFVDCDDICATSVGCHILAPGNQNIMGAFQNNLGGHWWVYFYNFAQGGGNGCAGQNKEAAYPNGMCPTCSAAFGTSMNDQVDAWAAVYHL